MLLTNWNAVNGNKERGDDETSDVDGKQSNGESGSDVMVMVIGTVIMGS